jgi:hypothetical protein
MNMRRYATHPHHSNSYHYQNFFVSVPADSMAAVQRWRLCTSVSTVVFIAIVGCALEWVPAGHGAPPDAIPVPGAGAAGASTGGETKPSRPKAPVYHLIAHSHCDPGWLETLDQYYRRDVAMILSNVVGELTADKSKRFIWAEVYS